MHRVFRLLLAALCSGTADALASDPPSGAFLGILPCADCPGVEYRLDLMEDGVFFQRSQYRERDGRFDHVGRWSWDVARKVVVLENGRRGRTEFVFESPDRLTLLDRDGQPIHSQFEHTLHRSRLLGRMEPQVTLDGLFRYYADSALLRDCATGWVMPVAMEYDYLRLERAWSRSGAPEQEPLPVRVQARIVERVNMEGPARPMVIVEDFVDAGPHLECSPPPASLGGTHWRLSWLGDEAVHGGPDAPYLSFIDGPHPRMVGSTGCNRMAGRYELDGDHLRFLPLATTKMACSDGMEREQALLHALSRVHAWRIEARSLSLLDEEGEVLARFEAAIAP